MKRILDCGPADFRQMDSAVLLEAVRRSEGRTVLCEVLWPAPPLVDGVSNAEVVVAFGADLVLLNMFDGEGLAGLKDRLGRPVGVNVEPSEDVPAHRRASRENLRRVSDADFVVVTANPDAEVGVEEMLSAVALVRETLPGAPVFAGKMHEYYVYKGEGHGFRTRENMIDSVRRGTMIREVHAPGVLTPEHVKIIAAVTAGPPLCRCATAPAVESASFMISPPCT